MDARAASSGGRPGCSEAESAVQACRRSTAAGRLREAARHLGRGLFHDPALPGAYVALEGLAEAAGSPVAARELFKGDGKKVFPGNAAAIITLMAGEGRAADAVELLGSVVAAHPERPWAAAPWFTPQLAQAVPPLSVGRAVSAIWQAVDSPAPPEAARPLAPWLALARASAGRPDADAACLCAFSALARRLGAHDDAVAWCRTAEEVETRSLGRTKQSTLIMLGYAHRDAGQPEAAIDAWGRAVDLPPANADLLLDLADLTLEQGDVQLSLAWAERSAAIDGTAVKSRAAVLAARYRAGRESSGGGDTATLTQLVDLVLAHPQVPYLHTCLSRACEGALWLRTVPAPTEAVRHSYGYLAGIQESGQGEVLAARSQVTALEAPTPTALHRARFPQAAFTAPDPRDPDPRRPVTTRFGPPLWTYRGNEATTDVAPPSPAAVDLLHEVAGGIWADPLVAYDRAAAFAELDVADLWGLLAHMPPPREAVWVQAQRELPLYWERFAQVWVCLGLLHHRAHEPWPRSTRRTLLLRLLFGPEDWTVDAAAFALCVAAWRHPEHRTHIADAVAERYLHAAEALGKRPTELHDPLAEVVLICPGIAPRIVLRARTNLARRADLAAPGPADKPTGSLFAKWTGRRNGRGR